MEAVVYQLRKDGKKLDPAACQSNPLKGRLQLSATDTVHYQGRMLNIGLNGPRRGQFDKMAPTLFEPKLLDISERNGKLRLWFIGFQTGAEGAGVVQEWVCDFG